MTEENMFKWENSSNDLIKLARKGYTILTHYISIRFSTLSILHAMANDELIDTLEIYIYVAILFGCCFYFCRFVKKVYTVEKRLKSMSTLIHNDKSRKRAVASPILFPLSSQYNQFLRCLFFCFGLQQIYTASFVHGFEANVESNTSFADVEWPQLKDIKCNVRIGKHQSILWFKFMHYDAQCGPSY